MFPLVYIYKKDQGHMTSGAVGTLKTISHAFRQEIIS